MFKTLTDHINWLIEKREGESEEAEQIRRDFYETLKHCGYIVPDYESSRPVRTGYMCKIDFDCELGAASGGNHVYPSIGDLRDNRGCIALDNIVEVDVREVKVVLDPPPDDGGCGITEVEICENRTVTEDDVRREEHAIVEWEARWGKPVAGKDDV